MNPPHDQILTASLLVELVNLNSLYVLTYGALFGMTAWQSSFGGIIAFRTLPRHQFGALQNKTFPIYFLLSWLLGSVLLGLWVFKHPDVVTNLSQPYYADVAQVYLLGWTILTQSFNYFVLGPKTSKLMFKRHRLEKAEGKSYNDPEASNEMRALSKEFMRLHGISFLGNFSSWFMLTLHGIWIANAGVKGY